MISKKCSRCKTIKSIQSFNLDKDNLDGHNYICRGCQKEIRRRYIDIAKIYEYTITVIEMPQYSKKKCVNRRMKNPHGQPNRKLWESVWNKFNNLYEKPTKKEGIDKIIEVGE